MAKRFLCTILTLWVTFSLLPAAALAFNPGIDDEAELRAAILAVDENGTVTLADSIDLENTLTINGPTSFTIDLSGFELRCPLGGYVMEYNGTGTLTITDSSSAGGNGITASSNVISSDGSGKILVSGKAAISSSDGCAFLIGGGSEEAGRDVLEIAGGTVSSTSTDQANAAIVNNGNGNVVVSGGVVGTVTPTCDAIKSNGGGNVTVSGGTVIGITGINAFVSDGDIAVSGGTVKGTSYHAINSYGNVILTGGTVENTASDREAIYGQGISIPSGTIVVKGVFPAMNLAPDLSGYTNYQWRTASDGTFTSSTTAAYVWGDGSDAYLEIKPMDPPTTYNRGSITTVYNDTNKPDATIWLVGRGLRSNDLLLTQPLTSGSNYNALLMSADQNNILGMYEISLQSGKSSTGSGMHLTFDLASGYAGQAFTLVHKKADGTLEYLYATAGADGNVKFGPMYELSPFMLVKGRMLYTPDYALIDVPKTGDRPSSLVFILVILAVTSGIRLVAYRKRHA